MVTPTPTPTATATATPTVKVSEAIKSLQASAKIHLASLKVQNLKVREAQTATLGTRSRLASINSAIASLRLQASQGVKLVPTPTPIA